MILTEYNEELHARTLVEEGRREEREKNARSIRQLLLQVLESKGRISAETAERINCENDPDILRDWASFAIGSSSVEEAERYISRRRF